MDEKGERLARAISASSRRQILHLLVDKERTVKDIAKLTKMSVSLTSRHLKLLYDLGLLNVKCNFPHKFYSIKAREIKDLLSIYDLVVKKI